MSFGPAGFGDTRVAGLTPDNFSGFGSSVDRRLFGGAGANFGLGAQADRRLAQSFSGDPVDMFEAQAAKQYAEMMAAYPTSSDGLPSASSMGNPTGGNWSSVNQWNSQVSSAISKVQKETGIAVPANIVKAVMELESGGVNVGMNSAGYGGLMQVGPNSNVSNYSSSYAATPEGNIYYGVQELANWYKVTKSWDTAPLAYFAGYNYSNPSSSDGHYTVADYQAHIQRNLAALNAAGGGSNTALPGTSGLFGGNGTQMGGALAGNSVVQIAQSYVGKIPYVWGGIPGKGQNPASTGWDCSGMTYWLDQNYGSGQLPMGSHYQYQYAQRTGQLFTDLSQLQPGDLIFINTGWQGGAGGDLNMAGHVAMYAGNGKIVHAANETEGTIISDLSRYSNILGAMHMSWSGGSGGGYQQGGQQYQQQTYSGPWWERPLSSLLGGR